MTLVIGLIAVGTGPLAQSSRPDPALTPFRVFLRDGRVLPAYGESAIVGDRVVFSLLIGGDGGKTATEFMSLPVASVDVDRTARYAKAVRAAYFAATSGEAEYQTLTTEVASTLDTLPSVTDPAARLKLVDDARERLRAWTAEHYDFHAADIQKFVTALDVAIGQLSAGAGQARMSLDLVAGSPPSETVQPPLSLRESISAALSAAKVADDTATREAVLRTVVDTLGGSDGVADLRAEAQTQLDHELTTDRVYGALRADLLARAEGFAKTGNVQGAVGLAAELGRRDAELGATRPAEVAAIADALTARLAVTRTFRAALDRYTVDKPNRLAYELRVRPILGGLDGLRTALTAIRDHQPMGYDKTARALVRLKALDVRLSRVVAPADLATVQAALGSVIGLATQACTLHREALVAPNGATATTASSSAAGALLLMTQARQDLVTLLFPPKPS